MTDKYATYAELSKNEKENEDCTIFHRDSDSGITVIASHGGGIESGTVDVADALAGCDYSFYSFKGLKIKGNRVLHLNSNRFDEHIGTRICQNSAIVISVQGSKLTTAEVERAFRTLKSTLSLRPV